MILTGRRDFRVLWADARKWPYAAQFLLVVAQHCFNCLFPPRLPALAIALSHAAHTTEGPEVRLSEFINVHKGDTHVCTGCCQRDFHHEYFPDGRFAAGRSDTTAAMTNIVFKEYSSSHATNFPIC
jgi:hypothetical protein